MKRTVIELGPVTGGIARAVTAGPARRDPNDSVRAAIKRADRDVAPYVPEDANGWNQ